MRLINTLTLLLCFCSLAATAQKQNWNKKQCAVVLTYDDALPGHLDHAVPALDSLKLKGTFYVTAASPHFTERLPAWKRAADNGHELANHTLFHPCDGSLPGRSFVKPDYNLATYSIKRITDEIRMTNAMLQAIDGKKERTFAYPCGDTKVEGVSYLDGLKDEFVAARGVHNQFVQLHNSNTSLYNIGCYGINGQSGDELVALVKKAMETNTMLVFLFHGVGGDYLSVSLEAHNQLLRFLKDNDQTIWNPTFLEAATYIKTAAAASK